MTEHTAWRQIKAEYPLGDGSVHLDEARITAFRELVYRLRTDANLTQAELARRMGTTQSAIARMEGGGTRPSLETLEKLAGAVGSELVVGVAPGLSENPTVVDLLDRGRAVVARATPDRISPAHD